MLNQPTSSPMMTRMLGLGCCADVGAHIVARAANNAIALSKAGRMKFMTQLHCGPTPTSYDSRIVCQVYVPALRDWNRAPDIFVRLALAPDGESTDDRHRAYGSSTARLVGPPQRS